jgi:pyruvate dehydrogenase E1 component beta subunit
MYGGTMKAPLTVRMIIGRGWGQGPQHSQSLQAWFAHVPGLKVVMPTIPHDAKGMLIAAVKDDAPVIIFEHRWLYNVSGEVPEGRYDVPLDRARIAKSGGDITIAATSYMTLEALRAADLLSEVGIEAEVIDLRCLCPIDSNVLLKSIRKTGNLIVADTGHIQFGVGAEVMSCAVEGALDALKSAPRRVGLPHVPTPTSPALADHYYPRATSIAQLALDILGCDKALPQSSSDHDGWLDQPDANFTGPY